MDAFNDCAPYARLPSKDHTYTLRSLFERYRDAEGACWVDADPPEYSVTSDTGEITCLTRVKHPLGIPHSNSYIGPQPTAHENLATALQYAARWVAGAIDTGYLWCPPGTVRCRRTGSGTWGSSKQDLGAEASDIMDKVQGCGFNPLSVSTVHAALESDKAANEETFRDFYLFPRTTIPSTSLFGTSHNNSFIDMSPAEKDKEPDMLQRRFESDHVGFICACHTSHSYEAGRSRRVATDVLVRLLSYDTYASIEAMAHRESCDDDAKDWLLWCCGQYTNVSLSTVSELCIYHRLKSMSSDPCFGLYVRESLKVCVICVSPGVLTKLCTNHVWSDSVNAHASDKLKFSVRPIIARSGPDFARSCLSAHYSYIPFVEHNAAIRTSISSAQIIQAVCLPYCPATASVSPCYTFKPIVTTRTYKRIMIEQERQTDLASYMPGENVSILYHNLPLNYDDAVIVSNRYVQNGGFSTLSTCRYVLPASDYVPEPGKVVCSRLSRWWKSGCQEHCKHTLKYTEECRVTSPFHRPTGVIVSKKVLKTGDQSVKVQSYETFQAGNKISTAHGQKGVCASVESYEDMPVCRTRDGQKIVPDVVMAVASIVRRQTAGQIYESGAGIRRLKDPSMNMVVSPDEVAELGEDVDVMDGRTGEFYKTLLLDGRTKKDAKVYAQQTVATLGFVRMFNQSQMTRERHFTSHRPMKSTTLRTPTKRSRGGAVREGEMEIQATVAAGLVNCAEELRKRGDEVVVLVCMGCQRLRLLHSCTVDVEFAEVTLPYDTVVLDCINKITYNTTFKYTLEPDV